MVVTFLPKRHKGTGNLTLCSKVGLSHTTLYQPSMPTIDGEEHFLDTPQLGAIPFRELKIWIGSAQLHQFEIQSALDRVFGAF